MTSSSSSESSSESSGAGARGSSDDDARNLLRPLREAAAEFTTSWVVIRLTYRADHPFCRWHRWQQLKCSGCDLFSSVKEANTLAQASASKRAAAAVTQSSALPTSSRLNDKVRVDPFRVATVTTTSGCPSSTSTHCQQTSVSAIVWLTAAG